MRRFDLDFLHSSVSIPDQERLADLLWKRDIKARLVVFGLEPDDPRNPASRLFGAEVVRGPNVISELEGVLGAFKPSAGVDDTQLHIMVVEDLESPRDIICILIESIGYGNVVGKESAQAALAELRKDPGKYCCVVTDIRMPQVNGAELIRMIRNDSRLSLIPVLVLTACGTADWLIECLKAGASGFLVKPPKKDDMRRELGRAVRTFSHGLNPRLVREEDSEALRHILEERGFA